MTRKRLSALAFFLFSAPAAQAASPAEEVEQQTSSLYWDEGEAPYIVSVRLKLSEIWVRRIDGEHRFKMLCKIKLAPGAMQTNRQRGFVRSSDGHISRRDALGYVFELQRLGQRR